jgi:hypothetical protein
MKIFVFLHILAGHAPAAIYCGFHAGIAVQGFSRAEHTALDFRTENSKAYGIAAERVPVKNHRIALFNSVTVRELTEYFYFITNGNGKCFIIVHAQDLSLKNIA